MIRNPTTADGYKSGLILNNPILELMGEGIWRADLTEINGALIDVEQMETRESTSTDITPLVELSSDEEMVQEEAGLSLFEQQWDGLGLSPRDRESWDTPVGKFFGMEKEDKDIWTWLRVGGLAAAAGAIGEKLTTMATEPFQAVADLNSKIDAINIKRAAGLKLTDKEDKIILDRMKDFYDELKSKGKRNTPKLKQALSKASFPRVGGGVLLGLDLIHIIRSVVEADPKDLTEGWEGPWIREFFQGAVTMQLGGEESVDVMQNATMKDLVWYAGALTGVNPRARLDFLKQIPKGIKDAAVAMIIDPVAWALGGIPAGQTVHPMNSMRGQSTPMGTGQPTRWE